MTNWVVSIATEYGTDISSRSAGQRLAFSISTAIFGEHSIDLDFAGVRTVSHSFADEAIAVVVARHGIDAFCRNVTVHNATDEVRRDLSEAIDYRIKKASA